MRQLSNDELDMVVGGLGGLDDTIGGSDDYVYELTWSEDMTGFGSGLMSVSYFGTKETEPAGESGDWLTRLEKLWKQLMEKLHIESEGEYEGEVEERKPDGSVIKKRVKMKGKVKIG